MIVLCLFATALVLSGSGPVGVSGAHGAQEPRVRWKGEDLELAELALRAGHAPVDAARKWESWANGRGVRFLLDDSARVLLVVSDSAPNPAPIVERIAETCELFDEILPKPQRPTVFEGTREAWMTSWAQRQAQLDRETIVLLQLESRADYAATLDHLAGRHDYLRAWAQENEKFSGYALEAPLVAGWIRTEGGDQNFYPENELVNRLAWLLVHRRFGKVPHWLHMGIAWHCEFEIMDSLYALPNALNYVYSSDFFGWDDHLRAAFKKRGDKPLKMDEIALWMEGTIDREAAARAWGLTRFLIREHGAELPEALDRLAAIFHAKGRVRKGNQVHQIPAFQPDPEEQSAVLKRLFGDDVLSRASEDFRTRKKERPR